jgi:hypothetical protein
VTNVTLTGNFLATARCLVFSDGGGLSWTFNSLTNTLTAAPTTGGGFQGGAPSTEGANLVLAGPTGGAAATSSFRALVTADLPAVLAVPASTGWGTPTGGSVENNFSGSAAPLTTCSAAIAQLIAVLTAKGILGT